jgi:hypothetical protein
MLSGADLVGGSLGEDPADCILVVAPGDLDPEVATAWSAVVAGMAETAPVAVVASRPAPAGTAGSAAEQGAAGPGEGVEPARSLVLGLRSSAVSGAVSTVDDADSGVGRVATVRVVRDLPSGARGHYGALRGAVSEAPAATG